jgi:hypothetical protein
MSHANGYNLIAKLIAKLSVRVTAETVERTPGAEFCDRRQKQEYKLSQAERTRCESGVTVGKERTRQKKKI